MISVYNESRTANWLHTIGDSQTDYSAGIVRPSYTWTPQLARRLRARGYNVRARGFGVSGNTSQDVLTRADVMFQYGTPDIALIHIGVNDPGSSISQAQTQANIQAIIKVLKHKAVSLQAGVEPGLTAANPAALPAGNKPGQRMVVLSDNDTTGGIAPTNPGAGTQITGSVAGAAQAVWECENPLAGPYGWFRVAVDATAPTLGAQKIVVVSTNYLNFTAGGDTPSTPYASYANVRAAQQAAVAAENVAVGGQPTVIYADVYGLLRTRIVGGTWPASGTQQWTFPAGTDIDFSANAYNQARSWHYAVNNQHKSAYGHQLDALAVETAIVNAGWLTSLKTLVNRTPIDGM